MLEVDGLPPADAPDVDKPLLDYLEFALHQLFQADFALRSARYDRAGSPSGEFEIRGPGDGGDPFAAILATRD